uniref:Uncharacterized protein n=1 Tax=Terrapene triunguis TaxID=2587831 RepID=A0A674J2K9_9SAUR
MSTYSHLLLPVTPLAYVVMDYALALKIATLLMNHVEGEYEPLWTTFADSVVKLRIDQSCSQTPITVHQMFKETVDKYGPLNAMASKKNGKWEKITFAEYYNLSWKAAKSFLKVSV